jgi:hypothetical protein
MKDTSRCLTKTIINGKMQPIVKQPAATGK